MDRCGSSAIQDIPLHVSTNCLMYADDVKLFHRVRDPGDAGRLQADLDALSRWSKTWRLHLNPAKCFTLTLTLKRQPVITDYLLDGVSLKRCSEARDLGLILDQKLTFAQHVDKTVSQGNRLLGLLIRSMHASRCIERGARVCFNPRPIICAFNAHIRSVLEYGSVIWGGAARSHFIRVERIQHKFLMWLATVSRVAPSSLGYEGLLRAFNMTSILSRFTQHDIMFLFNVYRSRVNCMDLVASFSLSAPVRMNRHLKLWHEPYARVETVKNGLFTRLPKLCNKFLESSRETDMFNMTYSDFIRAVKSYSSSVPYRVS